MLTRRPHPLSFRFIQRTVSIAISNLSLAPCANPVAAGTPGTSTFKAKCYELSGTATNPDKETVRNADVYGLVIGASLPL